MNNTKRKSHHFRDRIFALVEVTGFEPAASSSQNWRATNCATPRFRLQMSDIRRQTNVLAKPTDHISFHIFFFVMIMHFKPVFISFGNPLAVSKRCFPLGARTSFDRGASFCSLLRPPDAVATSPKTGACPPALHLDSDCRCQISDVRLLCRQSRRILYC